jgi:hypothetical protein
MSDEWIREAAQRHKDAEIAEQQQAPERRRRAEADRAFFQRHVPQLWTHLNGALRRRIDAYNETIGRQVLSVERHADHLLVRGERGGQLATVEIAVLPTSFSSRITAGTRSGGSRESEGPPLRTHVLHAEGLAFGDDGTDPEVGLNEAADAIVGALLEQL